MDSFERLVVAPLRQVEL